MSRFVLDCSVTMAWCFEDETAPFTEKVLDALSESDALVPTIWPLEVANVLVLAERRKRITIAKTSTFLRFLRELPIQMDEETPHRTFDDILNVARAQRLTVYDAAYLELALRNALPLATQDRGLRQAAKALGVALF